MEPARDLIVVCPQERDRALVAAAGLDRRYRIHYAGSDLDTARAFDPRAFLTEWSAKRADGVVATKDRSALLASLLAELLGVPGPKPDALLNCQHKGRSRSLQRTAAPEATPQFTVVRAAHDPPPSCPPPWFAKPIVGRLSQGARRVDDPAEFGELVDPSGYAAAYADIAELAGLPAAAVEGYLVEELARGREVTLEGYVYDGCVTVVGITDSVMYPGTNSFERFEYPSSLGAGRQEELAHLVERVVPALGFDGGFFNVEFFVADGEPARIIEVNGRLASQFAPLLLSVHGRSSYDALFRLALGEDPAWDPGPPAGVAVSYILRVFEDAFVAEVPEAEPDVEVLVRPGLMLSEQGANDTQSYRLAILYGAAATRDEAVARLRERARALSFRLAPAPVR